MKREQVERVIREGVQLRLNGGTEPFWMIWRQEEMGAEAHELLTQLVQQHQPANAGGACFRRNLRLG